MNRSKEVAKILEKYAKDIATTWPFYIKGSMPSDKIDNAMKTYAKGIDRKTIAGFYDITLFNNGKSGFIFTDKGIYYKDVLSPCDKLLYKNIESVKLGPKTSKEETRSIFFKLVDGTEEEWNSSYLKKDALKKFFDELLAFLNNESEKKQEIATKESKNKTNNIDMMSMLSSLEDKF